MPSKPELNSRSIFLAFWAAYLLSYLFRTINAVVSPELTRDLGLAPGTLGLLTSAYFVAFAAVQLPAGVSGLLLFVLSGLIGGLILLVLAVIGGLISVPIFEKRKDGPPPPPPSQDYVG